MSWDNNIKLKIISIDVSIHPREKANCILKLRNKCDYCEFREHLQEVRYDT